MNLKDYEQHIGKDKKQVIQELGDSFNFYPDNVWQYHLKKNFFGRNTFLVFYFTEDKISKIEIKNTFKKNIGKF